MVVILEALEIDVSAALGAVKGWRGASSRASPSPPARTTNPTKFTSDLSV